MIAAVPRTKPRATNPARHPRSPKVRFTEIEFCAWLAQADAGGRLEYYRGSVVADTLSPLSPLSPDCRTSLPLLCLPASPSRFPRTPPPTSTYRQFPIGSAGSRAGDCR